MWLLWAGCAPLTSLVDTPITGGTAELRERLRAELVAWDGAVGVGRVELREVRIVDGELLGEEHVVGYERNGVIRIAAHDDQPTSTLRHELCHALQRREDILVDPDRLWDGVARDLFTGDPNYLAARAAGLYDTPERSRREAMAAFCELGPDAIAGLAHPCPSEDPTVGTVADWLLREVYAARERPPAAAPDPTAVVTLLDPSPWDPLVAGTRDPGAIVVWGSNRVPGTYGLESGDPWPREEAPSSSGASPPLLRGVLQGNVAVTEDGAAAVRATSWLFHWQFASLRLYVTEGGGEPYEFVQGSCEVPPEESLFVADGRLFRAWVDDGALRWQPVPFPRR